MAEREPDAGRPTAGTCSRRRAAGVLAGLLVACSGGSLTAQGGSTSEIRPSVRAQRAAVERLVGLGAPVFCGGHRGNAVALTFDDGPGPLTGLALDVLAAAGARATFFDIGRNVIRFPDLAKREAAQQTVGDHTWSHPDLTRLQEPGLLAQMERARNAILRITGRPVLVLRPPYGASDDRVLRAAVTLDVAVILWSVYSGDTTPATADQIVTLTDQAARPGSIILLHEGNNHGVTIAALPGILLALKQRGLQAVTVPELMAVDPPSKRQLHTGPYACGPVVRAIDPQTGGSSGGNPITITGEELQPANAVYFGQTPALAFSVISPTQIVAAPPPGTGTVDVTVETHFGLSPTHSATHYTYGP